MRAALLHFAEVNHITPAPMRGYHETITLVWMRIGLPIAISGRRFTAPDED